MTQFAIIIFISIPEFLTNADAAQWSMYSIFCLAMLLLILPGLFFCFYGARIRRKEILENFDNNAAEAYLACFHPDLKHGAGSCRSAQERLIEYYNSQYKLGRFIICSLLCYCSAGLLGLISAYTATSWLRHHNLTEGFFPLNVVLAIMGGYTWVTYDQINRTMRNDLTSRSQLIGTFRLLIVVPMAYSISLAFNQSLGGPLAFLLGTFPTDTVMTIGRRVLTKIMPDADLPKEAQWDIQRLKSVDIVAAERFAEEGVSSITQLAYTDPVRLAIRTNLGFSYILVCTSEALLWIYLQDKTPLLRKIGISGAFECSSLWQDIKDDEDPLVQNRARAVVEEIRSILEINSVEGVNNLLYQVAEDPYIQFQRACWALPMMTNLP